MQDVRFSVISNEELARDTYRLKLLGDVSQITRAGQFVNVKIDGFYLRRPISVCDLGPCNLTLIYKAVGRGTQALSACRSGDELMVLTGLGNGYDTEKSGSKPILIGGGVGTPPLYLLCKRLLAEGKQPTVALGFNSADEVFLKEEFEALGVKTLLATADGSLGYRGFVTELINTVEYSYFYACGPEPMLRAVYRTADSSGQFSFEERMGCGFGACMGCSCKTISGNKRICKEGPVLEREEIIWTD